MITCGLSLASDFSECTQECTFLHSRGLLPYLCVFFDGETVKKRFVGSKPDFDGWETIDWEIVGSKLHSDDLGEVVYDIKEVIPKGMYVSGQDVAGKTASFRETMEWWKIDNEWYVLAVGFRGRFAFSSGIELSRVPGKYSRVETLENYDTSVHESPQ